jgi:small basic protein
MVEDVESEVNIILAVSVFFAGLSRGRGFATEANDAISVFGLRVEENTS